MKKLNFYVSITLFIILIPIILLLTDVQIIAFDRDYYPKELEKFNIAESLDIEQNDLVRVNDNVLDYLEQKSNNLDAKFFSERDRLHMVDVLELFKKGRMIRDLSAIIVLVIIIYFIIKRVSLKIIGKTFITISLFSLLCIIILVLLMSIDFYKYFTVFHHLFFSNDLWLLDPRVDMLVNIYPEAYFTDMAFRISKWFIIQIILILSAGIILIRNSRS